MARAGGGPPGRRSAPRARPPLSGPWRPRLDERGTLLDPRPGDRYLVMDDLTEDRVVVVVSPWPQLDEAGHLRFDAPDGDRDPGLADASGGPGDDPDDDPDDHPDDQGGGVWDGLATEVLDLDLDALQSRLDAARAAAGQAAPDRPLRVGDVLWLRGPAGTPTSGGRGDERVRDDDLGRSELRDVTRAARASARAAQLVAADPLATTPSPPRAAASLDRPGGDEEHHRPRRPPSDAVPPAL